MRYEFNMVSDGGKYRVVNRKLFVQCLSSFRGKPLTLTVERKKKKRSSPQNRYYWGVVVPIIQLGLLDAGWDRIACSKDNVHELLKSKFLPNREVTNLKTGEIMEMPGSTAECTTTEMMEYIDEITAFAAEFLGVQIPAPNEELELTF